MSIFENYKNSKKYVPENDTSATGGPNVQIVKQETFKKSHDNINKSIESLNAEVKNFTIKLNDIENETNKLKGLDMDSLVKKHANLKDALNVLTTDHNNLKTDIQMTVNDINMRLSALERTLL